jgi:hypothetical protein
MIIAERKPLDEILQMLGNEQKLLLLGCNTCTTICFAGGEKEVGILAAQLRLKATKEGRELITRELTIQRQCESEFLEGLKDKVSDVNIILSMACGAGVQLVAEYFDSKLVLPALNTKFIGIVEQQGVWSERCNTCGDCLLALTGGICPITRCPKSLLNGPCGGSQEGKCEVNRENDCAWQLIYDKLKRLGRLEFFDQILPIKDWSKSAHGGVRKIIRKDLVIEHEG